MKSEEGNKLSEAQIKRMRKVFDEFDKDSNDYIDADEFSVACEQLGFPKPSDDDLDQLFKTVDKDQNGKITFDEFTDIFGQTLPPSDQELHDVFLLLDRNEDGKIAVSELYEAFQFTGETIVLHDCIKIMQKVDNDNDGFLSFEDFRIMYMNFHEGHDGSAEGPGIAIQETFD